MNNTLIAVSESTINDELVQTVNARELHEFLEVKSQFSHWIQRQIDAYNFTQGIDFITIVSGDYSPPRKDYHITLDMGKELAMVERTAKGKEVRQYFIQIEKEYRDLKPKELTREEILVIALESERERLRLSNENEKLVKVNEEMKPKADYHDRLLGYQDTFDADHVAKLLKTSKPKLFSVLRMNKVFMQSKNIPMQKFIDRGFMVIRPTEYKDHFGKDRVSLTTEFTQIGIQYTQQLIDQFFKAAE